MHVDQELPRWDIAEPCLISQPYSQVRISNRGRRDAPSRETCMDIGRRAGGPGPAALSLLFKMAARLCVGAPGQQGKGDVRAGGAASYPGSGAARWATFPLRGLPLDPVYSCWAAGGVSLETLRAGACPGQITRFEPAGICRSTAIQCYVRDSLLLVI